jgi:hypothetical protein
MQTTNRWLAAIFCGGVLSIGLSAQNRITQSACAGLTSLKLPDIKIGEAVDVPAAISGAIRAAHCRVTGVIGTEIRFSLLLPNRWNGKFMMGGGGGYVGTLDNQAKETVNAGYATAGTDTGHQGNLFDASWALNNLERQLNFGYVAVHRTAETAKAIVRHYYGTTEKASYFSGCSNGGRQGLMEAQRFPDDFDGIVAGAPALDSQRPRCCTRWPAGQPGSQAVSPAGQPGSRPVAGRHHPARVCASHWARSFSSSSCSTIPCGTTVTTTWRTRARTRGSQRRS